MKPIITLLVALGTVALTVCLYSFLVHRSFGWDWDKSGVFGDSFGALNTVFTGVALAGLGINIWAQNQTYRQQQGQIDQQRRRLDDQEREVKIQRSFALLSEWQSEPIHAARTAIYGLTEGLRPDAVLSLSEYEQRQLDYLKPGGDRAAKETRGREIGQIFTVLYFFERLGFLLQADVLDVNASRKMFAEPCRAYGRFIRTLREKEEARGDMAKQNWIDLLTEIDRQVLAVLAL